MAKPVPAVLTDVYRRRIREPRTDDEVLGYWIFVVGLVLGALSVALVFGSDVASDRRGLGIAIGGIGLVGILLGAILRLELRERASYLAIAGAVVSLLAVLWFLAVYPMNWQFGTQQVWNVLGLGAVGLALMIVSAVVVPLVMDPREAEIARAEAERDAVAAERDSIAAERNAVAAERDTAAGDAKSLKTEATETASALEELRRSLAQFELFEDAAGKYRWRLRHRNGNVIADGGQGYASRQKAQQGLGSVRANALGAALVDLGGLGLTVESVDDALEETPILQVAESSATFELYEDNRGKHRWRLRHDNGEIIADSGQGYATRSGLSRALDRVRTYAADAAYLRVAPAAFEVYRDRSGAWRWRLIHENGNILADGGESYSGRTRCREGAESVRRNADGSGDAEFEVYEDNRGEYRWRLRHANGEIIADSGEGYSSEDEAENAVERLGTYAPDADLLDVGTGAFEIYEDKGEEWRWRLRARNGNIMADSGQGYGVRSDATEAVTRVKRHAPGAEELTVEE